MEQVFTNIELVTNICKFLNYEEQFKLTHVSSQLRNIIVNFVWNVKFRKVGITMMEMSFLVSDTLREHKEVSYDYFKHGIWRRNSFILTSKNLNIFLNLNMNNIKKFHLNKYNAKCDAYESIKNALPFSQKFPNLTELSCWEIKLEKRDLKQVAVNCAKLETLILYYCSDLNGSLLDIGLDIDIQILKAMQNLNNLCISTGYCTFSVIKEILNQLKLQQLSLEGIIHHDSENINDLNLWNLKYYKEVDIHRFWNESNFLHFQTNFLPHMENLCNLSLSVEEDYIIIEKEFFNVLLESCKSLTYLRLRGFAINDFIALPLLNELYLKDCEGLTYSHLKTILSEMHLKCFKSSRTEYEGVFECFPISLSLQKLDIKSDDNDLIKLLEFNEATLMNLTEITYDGIQQCRVSNFAKNLKVLNIEYAELFAEDCLKLKYLQELKLGTIAISDFLLLLKHENLQRLSFLCISYSSDQKSVALKEIKNLHTNLRYLEAPYKKEFISDILLDLFNMNTKLSFACGVNEVELIIDILIDGKFPKRFKNIKIRGVSIDCNSIRNKCEDTMNKMKNLIDSREHMVAYFLLQ